MADQPRAHLSLPILNRLTTTPGKAVREYYEVKRENDAKRSMADYHEKANGVQKK